MRRPPETTPSALARPLRAVARRVRLQRALDAATLFAVAGLGLAAAVLAVDRVLGMPAGASRPWLIAAASLPLLGALAGAVRPVSRLLPAQLLDRAHGLRSRITSALELAATPAAERTDFVRAAIGDAEARAGELDARRALPLRRPRGLGPVAALGAGVAGLAVMVPPPPPTPPRPTAEIAPLLLHPDDIDAFRSDLDAMMAERNDDPELARAARRYNQLLEDLAERRLDRTEALRRIAQLEQGLTEGRAASADALDESLRALGRHMGRSKLLRETAEALRQEDAAQAERKMHALAEKLRKERTRRSDRVELQRDLERAVAKQRERQQEQSKRMKELRKRQEQLERLLNRQREKQKKQQQDQSEQDQHLLKQRKRQLEQLRREQQRMEEQQRQLEQLQRDLQEAAEQLRQEMNDQQQEQAGDSLDQGAQDLNRMARQQMTEEQMRQMARQLRQLRELVRRMKQQQGQPQGQGKQGQGQQGQDPMQRFILRANGRGDGEEMPILMPGQQGQQGQSGGQGQGQQGRGQQQGQGQGGGQGQGQGGQKALMLGGQGKKSATLEIPGMGKKGHGAGQGEHHGETGPGIGTGHDPHRLDDPTKLRADHENTRVEGQEGGSGPSRSEVILGAADKGFTSRSYEKVYTDYRDHAEEVLEQDEVPPGYRFYVRRYFQLIRPREEQ